MEFRLLGPLEVWDEGRALELRGLKRRAVLALLLVHANEVVSRDRLIDELWEEHPPANASAALQNHISRLRKDLGPELLVTRESGYLLAVDPDSLDVRRFEALVEEAAGLPAPERRAKLDEALSLWRGPALADLLQEHTLAIESGRLEGLRLSALEGRIQADLDLGRHEQLVPEIEALIAAHPLREHLRALLILALYRSGRQAEALEAYRETRRVLVDELGIDPGPDLRELEQAILRQDPALDAPEPVPVVAAAAAASSTDAVPVEARPAPTRQRWPLLVAVALLLGAAGVAAGFLISGPGPGEASEAIAGDTGSFIPSLGRLTTRKVTTGRQQETTVTTPATTSTTTHPPPTPTGTGGQRPVTVVMTQPPPPPPVAAQVGHTANPPPPPPPPPPPVRWAYWLRDDFADPDVDAMWATTKSGPGIDMAEQTDRLEVWVPADPAPDPDKGIGEVYLAECAFVGDFDVSVDYALPTWPAGNGLRLGLSALVSAVGRDFTIERAGGHADGFGGEAYESNVNAATRVRTADRHGGLRLVRRKGVVRAYYRYRGKWIRLGTQKAKGQAALRLSFKSDDPPWGGEPALAAFDNFQAIVDGVNCPPGTPLPPRKRRT